MALGLLCSRGSLTEVRVSSDPNLVLRLLKDLRVDVGEVGKAVGQLRTDLDDFRRETSTRFERIEHTLNGMAGHLFALTDIVKGHERRIRRLEARPTKA